MNLIQDKLIASSQANLALGKPTLPCRQYCQDVITRCFGKANLSPLQEQWRKYIGQLEQLGNKLGSSYNVALAIEPLDIKVSEAIMNFQDNGSNITDSVYKACGTPQSPRSLAPPRPASMRDVPMREVSSNHKNSPPSSSFLRDSSSLRQQLGRRYRRETMKSSSYLPSYINSKFLQQHAAGAGGGGQNPLAALSSAMSSMSFRNEDLDMIGGAGHFKQDLPTPDDTMAVSAELPTLIEEISKYMSTKKLFWSNLPNEVCSSKDSMSNQPLSVLNVTSSSLQPAAQPNSNLAINAQRKCFDKELAAADINVDFDYRWFVSNQTALLVMITQRINDALEGKQIDWAIEKFLITSKMSRQRNNFNFKPPSSSPPPAPLAPPTSINAANNDPDADNDDYDPEDPIDSGSGAEPESSEDSEQTENTDDPTNGGGGEGSLKPGPSDDASFVVDPSNSLLNSSTLLNPSEPMIFYPAPSFAQHVVQVNYCLSFIVMLLATKFVIDMRHS